MMFVRSGTAWSQQAKLKADDPAEQDNFGTSVSVSGAYAMVGALMEDAAGGNSGAAYMFVRSGTGWSQQVKLTADDASPSNYNDVFGHSVSVDGDYAIVGAIYEDSGGKESGAA